MTEFKNRFLTLTLNICEWLKLRNDNVLSKIRYVKYIGYIWYRLLSNIENFAIKHIDISSIHLSKNGNESIVASLTTFPARIENVHLTIKSIFLQTVRPNRIVLWLADSQFSNTSSLPKQLLDMCNLGLEIKFCPDYRSHKKYFFMLQQQKPNELVVTFDDDIIYNLRTIERAVNQYLRYPDCVIVNQTHRIKIQNNAICPYQEWRGCRNETKKPSFRNSILSGSGCLYPYGLLPEKIFDWKAIQAHALTADDLWVWANCVSNGIRIVCTQNEAKIFTTINNSQSFNLSQINCIDGGNDDTIANLCGYFPNLIANLTHEQ